MLVAAGQAEALELDATETKEEELIAFAVAAPSAPLLTRPISGSPWGQGRCRPYARHERLESGSHIFSLSWNLGQRGNFAIRSVCHMPHPFFRNTLVTPAPHIQGKNRNKHLDKI